MPRPLRQIHLLRETPLQLEAIEVPSGASFVVASTEQGLQFSEKRPPRDEQILIVEPVHSGVRTTLLVLSQFRDHAVKINGRPTPPLALAAVGDQLTLDNDLVFRVLLHQCPSIGAPAEEQVGKECLVCRIPIVEGAWIYTCLNGCTLHCESEDQKSGAEPLECARLVTECPACRTPINLEKGYTHVPEI